MSEIENEKHKKLETSTYLINEHLHWQKNNLEKVVANHTTYAGMLKAMGLQVKGSSVAILKKYIKLYNLDMSHYIGWCPKTNNKKRSLSFYLVENSDTICKDIKQRLVSEGFMTYECVICSINEWCGEKIVLQLDHINGNNKDNRIENLRFLCPNCHSQTSTYAGKNITKSEKNRCVDCKSVIGGRATRCRTCSNKNKLGKRKVNLPSIEELIELILCFGQSGAARRLGVARETLFARFKENGIDVKTIQKQGRKSFKAKV